VSIRAHGDRTGEPRRDADPGRDAMPDADPESGQPPPLSEPGPLDLNRLARQLAALASNHPDLAAQAAGVAERLETQQFHILVLGEFKRGKSTLVNALVGHPVVPTGVLPLTAVATEVHFGAEGSSVLHTDGRRRAIEPGELATYVTEAANPGNRLGVERVEVAVGDVFPVPGVVVVDSPGIGSVHAHNTAQALAALERADAAIMVLAADNPLSAAEQSLLQRLGERRTTVFVVVNKADHLSGPELDEVRSFVAEHASAAIGHPVEPYLLSARAAANAVPQRGRSVPDAADPRGPEHVPDPGADGFAAFRHALERFVVEDLDCARRATALAKLARVAHLLEQAAALEAAAAELDADTLRARLARLGAAIEETRVAHDEDRVLLDHAVAHAGQVIGEQLRRLAAAAAHAAWPALQARLDATPRRELERALPVLVEQEVRAGFEPIRRETVRQLEDGWAGIASQARSRHRERVAALVDVASELFETDLRPGPAPALAGQPEQFSYLFLTVEGPSAGVERTITALLPAPLARRRARRRAWRRLAADFDKHAGRARHDLVQRLEAAAQALSAELGAELEETGRALRDAATAASRALRRADSAQEEQALARQRIGALATEITRLLASSEELACAFAPRTRNQPTSATLET